MLKKITAAIIGVIMCAGVNARVFAETNGYTEAIPFVYEEAVSFSEGLALAGAEGQFGFIDKSGNMIMTLDYDGVRWFREGMAAVWLNEKSGFINKEGREIIPPRYDVVFDFSEGLALVYNDEKFGYIDEQGNEAIPFIYDWARHFSDGLAAVAADGKIGYIDKTGREAIPFMYDFPDWEYGEGFEGVHLDFSEGAAAVYKKDAKQIVYIDKSGNELFGLEEGYICAGPFKEGLARVFRFDIENAGEQAGHYLAFIDKSGGEAFRVSGVMEGESYFAFSEGLTVIMGPDFKFGFADRAGNMAIPFMYDGAMPFSEGAAAVMIGEKWGFIDKTGREIVPPVFDQTWGFSEGLAAVMLDDRWGFISLGGEASQQAAEGGEEEAPEEPEPAAPVTPAAVPASSAVYINGVEIFFDAYNIGGFNYFKLRDLAFSLNGTAKQFDVGWDRAANAISLESGREYQTVGGEMERGGAEAQTPTPIRASVFLDGGEVQLEAYTIGGFNYFRLRDIGELFGFTVDWDRGNDAIIIDTE